MVNHLDENKTQRGSTMSEHPLYQAIRQELERFLPNTFGEALRHMLVWMVLGIIESESASPARIARALGNLGMSGAQVSSLERRVRRVENAGAVTAVTCLHRLARYHLCLGKPQRLVVAIDPTTQAEHVVMLTVSVVYRGRSLPLAWTVWAGNVPLQGVGFWARVEQVLDEVQTILPIGIPIIWVADRAFGTPQFTDLVTARGWHYVVRVQGQTRYQDQQGRLDSIRHLVQHKGERGKRRGLFFKGAGWREASGVVVWGRRHTAPLCLVSDLPPDWELITRYRQRYTIEALFRDYKSAGWHWEQGQVRDLNHLHRLLVFMALAAWFALLLGTQVAHECLSQPPSTSRRTPPFQAKFSLFQLGLQRLHRWLHPRTDHPLVWWLTDWDAPPWYTQILNHHRRAFIFA